MKPSKNKKTQPQPKVKRAKSVPSNDSSTIKRLSALTEKLRLQNEKLETILQVSPAALMIVDAETDAIVEVNSAWTNILGFKKEDILKQPNGLEKLFRDRAEFTAMRDILVAGSSINNQIFHFEGSGHQLKVVQIYASAFSQNQHTFFIFNFCDLTDSLSNEKMVTNFDQKIRNLLKALDASSLVSTTDAEGTIIYANDRFCEVSEYAPEELLGQNHDIVNSNYHSKEFMQDLWNTITEGKIWRGDIRNRTKSGGHYWVQSTIIPFLDRNGKPYQFCSIRYDISRRKLYEEKLIKSNEALANAQQLARLGTWEWSPSEDSPSWSSEMFKIFGLPRDTEAVNFKKIPEFYADASWVQLEACVKRTLETGEPYTLECEIIRADKTNGWVIASGVAVRDDQGNITGLRGTVQDITQRKQAEERNHLIVNALPDLIFILNNEGVFLDYHASDKRQLAFPPAQFIGKTFSEVFPPELATRMQKCIEDMRTENTIQSLEYSLTIPTGVQHFEANFSKLDSHRIMAVVRDTTERKKADAMVREQATLLDKASDAIMVKSVNHEVQYWNKSAERIYGWPKEEIMGKSTRDVLYETTDEYDAAMSQVNALGEYRAEINQITKDRRPIVVQARWTLLRDAAGNPKSMLCIASDITDRRKLEQQFLRAQRLESIGTLAGGIAHDLNNMLTPILLGVEILKTGDLNEDQKELISTVEMSARRGAAMVKQVLSFARGAEGSREPMRIDTLIGDLEKIIRDTFPKNIRLSLAVAKNLWPIKGDITQLHQVLLNIAVNARDAMLHGGELHILAENRLLDEQYAGMNPGMKPGNFVSIKLEDNGTGMPPGVLEKIFEPFFTTKDLGKGTGLGLSTSIAIIRGHGGIIQAYSEPGKGTRFHIYLPALPASESPAIGEKSQALPRGEGQLILLVDDEAPIRSITRQTLEAFGYKVLIAADGAEGLAVFTEHKSEIALVLTDMMMPVLDGLGMIQVIRKLSPKLPIIAASGLDANGKTARLHENDVKTFLTKPYSADQLLKAISQALSDATK